MECAKQRQIIHMVTCTRRWIDSRVSTFGNHLRLDRPIVIERHGCAATRRQISCRCHDAASCECRVGDVTSLGHSSDSQGVPGLSGAFDPGEIVLVEVIDSGIVLRNIACRNRNHALNCSFAVSEIIHLRGPGRRPAAPMVSIRSDRHAKDATALRCLDLAKRNGRRHDVSVEIRIVLTRSGRILTLSSRCTGAIGPLPTNTGVKSP